MSSRSATRRPSPAWMAEQQPFLRSARLSSAPRVPVRMNSPITSYPCSFSRYALTELSTPPLMASTTRLDIQQFYGNNDPQIAQISQMKIMHLIFICEICAICGSLFWTRLLLRRRLCGRRFGGGRLARCRLGPGRRSFGARCCRRRALRARHGLGRFLFLRFLDDVFLHAHLRQAGRAAAVHALFLFLE